MHKQKIDKGFSLLELSIVLIIIGGLVAGVLVGRTVIEGAKLNSQISQLQSYERAHIDFVTKYDAIPGDFNEAVEYFGADTSDGNGDTLVEFGDETVLYWQHLSLSKIIPDQFKGLAGDTNVPGEVSPISKMTEEVSLNAIGSSSSGGGFTNFFQMHGAFTPEEYVKFEEKIDDGDRGNGKVYVINGPVGLPGIPNCDDLQETRKACGMLYRIDDR